MIYRDNATFTSKKHNMAFDMLAARTSVIRVAKLFGSSRIIVHSLGTVIRTNKQEYLSTHPDRATKGNVTETRPLIYSHAIMPAVLAGSSSFQTPPRFKPDDKKTRFETVISMCYFLF